MYVKDITLQTVLDGLVDDMMALQEKGIQATVGSFRAIHFHSLGSSIYRSINNHHLGKRGEGSEMLSPVIGVSVLIQRLFFWIRDTVMHARSLGKDSASRTG